MATTLLLSPERVLTTLALLCMAGTAALIVAVPVHRTTSAVPLPQTAIIPPATLMHRLDGEYNRAGKPVDAPRVAVRIDEPLEIMRYQVTAADYVLCVAAGACKHPDGSPLRGDLPAIGVSYADATDYATWLSRETGAVWRLPTDREWAHAAGSRFIDDARGLDPDDANPARRWLADYEREAARKAASDPSPRPVGSFGANEHGIYDVAGNVWEWTQSCQRRVTLDSANRTVGETSTCGIYVVEGQHRTMIPFFIRNPKSGGCSVGTPPDNLGFRLVKEPHWRDRLAFRLRQLLPRGFR
ncbi:SUMF1/EgtB/PvdO family nonheme iron enzyme [Microvirga terricola]|uniref:Formylglycine-generating enzyme family protein n=1 Tax=Microvirga terricola TaxID=2719797 RepID=A0ABX0VF83_9HYPH|nr:formylglycine-generating enzyme family protein [Microvirga terricola]NIX77340.1 formylglycine-generating enzyme family protein [Microvirga terricola]